MDLAIAGLFFYFPWANFPQPRYLRTALLHIPTWGTANEKAWTLTPLLAPETLVVIAIAVAVVISMRHNGLTVSAGTVVLLGSSSLMIAGGLLSLTATHYPGISIGGLVGRLTVFVLASTIALSSPKRDAIRLWTYAAIAGTSVMCAAGLFFFVRTFGVPTSIAALPGYRVSPAIIDYEKATYGFASNTVDLLVMTIPVAIVLLIASETRTRVRILLAVAVILMVANLAIGFERWGWVCIVGAMVLTIVYYRHRSRTLPVALIGLGVVVVAAVFSIGKLGAYFVQALEPASGSNIEIRVGTWVQGIHVLATHLVGVGLGTEGTVAGLPATSAHNLFIDIGVEGGLLAMAGALLWAAYHTRLVISLIRSGDTNHELAFALVLGTVTFVVFGLFFNSLLYFSGLLVWLAFWWCFPVFAAALMPSDMLRLNYRKFEKTPQRLDSTALQTSAVAH